MSKANTISTTDREKGKESHSDRISGPHTENERGQAVEVSERETSTMVPNGAIYVGNDEFGGFHHYVESEKRVYVCESDSKIEAHNVAVGLGSWIEFVRDKRGWDTLQTTTLLDALTEARQ